MLRAAFSRSRSASRTVKSRVAARPAAVGPGFEGRAWGRAATRLGRERSSERLRCTAGCIRVARGGRHCTISSTSRVEQPESRAVSSKTLEERLARGPAGEAEAEAEALPAALLTTGAAAASLLPPLSGPCSDSSGLQDSAVSMLSRWALPLESQPSGPSEWPEASSSSWEAAIKARMKGSFCVWTFGKESRSNRALEDEQLSMTGRLRRGGAKADLRVGRGADGRLTGAEGDLASGLAGLSLALARRTKLFPSCRRPKRFSAAKIVGCVAANTSTCDESVSALAANPAPRSKKYAASSWP
mmetsp:Transcript_61726/g.198937  ORF Transcript_61726/g.198937 Transcript_61726/m.198937 type:complete len:301 (+) Transcript_61726:625-1527(+)